ncbi:MAG: tetratricopeptide repeat protein [bacterium]
MRLFLLFSLILLCKSLLAQPVDSDVDSTLKQANDLYASHNLKDAKKEYKRVLKKAPESLAALRGLSRIAIEDEDWGDVKDWNKRIVKQHPSDLLANYNLAIAHRETGKYKALLLRKRDFDRSREFFDKVIAQDSTFRDVLLQRGVLERHKKNWRAAISWGHRQLALKPGLVSGHVGLHHFYRLFLSHSGDKEVQKWLSNQNRDWAGYVSAEHHRRRKRFAQADSMLHSLLEKERGLSKVPIYLSLVRLRMQQDKPEDANSYYWQALDSIENDIDFAFLFEDAKYIFADDELEQLASLSTFAEKQAFLRRFWLKRELAPASPLKFRLVEHYRRLVKAEHDYWFDGVRSAVNNPDRLGYLAFPEAYYLNKEFNDKGLVFIRHGEPDDVALTAGQSLPSNESWLYYKREDRPKLVFHFLISKFGTGNNWRLAPSLENRNMLADRAGWDHSINRLLQSGSVGEFQSHLIQMSEESREMVSFAMSSDFHTWSRKVESLDVRFHTATFRGQDGKTRLEIYFGVPLEQVRQDEESAAAAPVEYGSAILATDFEEIESSSGQEAIKGQQSDGAGADYFLRYHHFELEPDSYHLSFYARQGRESATLLGGENFETQVPAYDHKMLSLSDLLPASALGAPEGQSSVKKGEWSLVPNPAKTFDPAQPVYLYYEVYNLSKNSDGETTFEIENEIVLEKKKKGGLGKVFGFLGGGKKQRVSIKDKRQGGDSDAVELMSFDVSNLDEGEYVLRVKLTDLVASKSVEKSVRLSLEKTK